MQVSRMGHARFLFSARQSRRVCATVKTQQRRVGDDDSQIDVHIGAAALRINRLHSENMTELIRTGIVSSVFGLPTQLHRIHVGGINPNRSAPSSWALEGCELQASIALFSALRGDGGFSTSAP